MIPPARLVVTAVLLILSAVISSPAQTTSDKVATASISGKVKIKDKAAAGITVFAMPQRYGSPQGSQFHAITDQTGNYRITNIPAGTYTVRPLAPSFALDDYVVNSAVAVSDGETVEDINFSMVPGGVITGKITDADGKPLIEEYVDVMPVEPGMIMGMRFDGPQHTDDRGVYRVFGLRPGKYKVSIGVTETLPGNLLSPYRQTFYPSVTDFAKATVIEVTEGGEAANIDIVAGRPITTYKVIGRVVEAETGKPLVHMRYGVYQGTEHGGSSSTGRNATDANGEFKLENVMPGKYSVFIVPEDSGVRDDYVSFEVVDRDVTDLVIKAAKAASVTGVVGFEGEESKSGFKPNELYISAWVDGSDQVFGSHSSKQVNPDGSFRIGGLRKGVVRFFFGSSRDSKRIQLVRVERDGVVQSGGLTLRDGEQVTGVRLVVKYLTGAIHGQIKFEGEEAPVSQMRVWITYLDERQGGEPYSMSNSSPELDPRKRFTLNGLMAGTYEVNVMVFEPGRHGSQGIYKQQVTVADNAVSDVTITIKNKPEQ
jgi:hypothetical protein